MHVVWLVSLEPRRLPAWSAAASASGPLHASLEALVLSSLTHFSHTRSPAHPHSAALCPLLCALPAGAGDCGRAHDDQLPPADPGQRGVCCRQRRHRLHRQARRLAGGAAAAQEGKEAARRRVGKGMERGGRRSACAGMALGWMLVLLVAATEEEEEVPCDEAGAPAAAAAVMLASTGAAQRGPCTA